MMGMPDRTSTHKKSHDSPVTATPQTVRQLNRAVVLDLIRKNQPLSRAELARISGINPSNISSIVEDLTGKGLLREERAKGFGRGRAPDLISLDRSAFRVMAISLLRSRTTVAIATLAGNIENSFTFATPDTPQEFAFSVESAYREMEQNLSLQDGVSDGIRQVVISSPGILNRHRNGKTTMIASDLPNYSNADLVAMMKKKLNLPVTIANNAGLAAMSLIYSPDYAKVPLRDFVLLVIGECGVGAGLVIQRDLYSGYDAAYAGEVGHTVVESKGRPCTCGRCGCLQQYICDVATWRRYKPNVAFSPQRFAGFLEDVLAGGAKARAALRPTIEYLKLGISNIMLMLNPERIILAGSLMKLWPILEKELESSACYRQRHTLLQATQLPVDTLYLRGAVERALQQALAESPKKSLPGTR